MVRVFSTICTIYIRVPFYGKLPYFGTYMCKITPLSSRDYTTLIVVEIVCQLSLKTTPSILLYRG